MFNVYGLLMDIVTAIVSYHEAKILEGMKLEIRELNDKNSETLLVHKSEIIYSQNMVSLRNSCNYGRTDW